MKIFISILFLLSINLLFAQTTNIYFTASNGRAMRTYDTTFQGSGPTWNAKVTMPVDHDSKLDSTSALIGTVGLGEVGNNWDNLLVSGWHYWLNNGWDGTVSLPNGVHNPIIITLQPSSAWPAESITTVKLFQILNRYKIKRGVPDVKKGAVHVSGLSMGGWTWTTYVTGDASAPYPYARIISSIFESAGASPAGDNPPYPDLFDRFAIYGNAGFGGNLLGFEQQNDGRAILARVNRMNSNHEGSFYIRTNFGTGGHTNFNDHFNPFRTDWTTGSPNVIGTTPSGGIAWSAAQWQLLQGDTVLPVSTNPGDVILNPISDFTHIFSHTSTPSFNITATVNQGTVATWLWEQETGPFLTLSGSGTSTVTVSNITTAGYYTFRVTGWSAGATSQSSRTVTVWVRDLMQKNVNPCRAGGGLKFTIGATVSGSKVTTTQIYMPYINRDNDLGTTPLGGDTLLIVANPNGPTWQGITLGDFGGGPGCPIVVMADSVVKIGATSGYLRLGTQDSNVVAHVHLNGLANRAKKGVVYGFQYDRGSFANEPNAIAFNNNLVHHLEIDGVSVINAGVGIMVKKNSSQSNPFTLWDNFRLKDIKIHDVYMYRINGEGCYLGHTDIAGDQQAGNDGRTVVGDGLEVYRTIYDSVSWDALQVSNWGYGVKVHHNVSNRSGTSNTSSQQWSIFIGGNTQGELYDNIAINGTGPFGTLGKGNTKVYNNLVDSSNNGLGTSDGIYVHMSTSGQFTPVDSLRVEVYNNTIGRNSRHAVNVNDINGSIKSTRIQYNTSTQSSNNTFTSNVPGATISGNTVNPSYNYDVEWGNHSAYKVYKLMRSRPPGYLTSFFDLDGPVPPPTVKPIGLNKGHRIKFKSN